MTARLAKRKTAGQAAVFAELSPPPMNSLIRTSLFSGLISALALGQISPNQVSAADKQPPNVVVIFIDDMGYADIGPFGAEAYPTPHLDRMAKEGRKFTDFYVTQAVCSASRRGRSSRSSNWQPRSAR